VPAKIISERLGHASAAFTLQPYTHVTPGMDRAAAESVAALILGQQRPADSTDVRDFVRKERDDEPEKAADLGKSPGQRW
jgi:hypothetical protein